jgi:hypothetical protein
MDGLDNYRIDMDYSLAPGSGKMDMFLYVPTTVFDGALPTDIVYLYSHLGLSEEGSWGISDGFEEWALYKGVPPIIPPAPVPEPHEYGMAAVAFLLLVAGFSSRKRVNKAGAGVA